MREPLEVSSDAFTDEYRALSREAASVMLYVWVGPVRLPGEQEFRLPLGYVTVDMGIPESNVATAVAELEEAGYLKYDNETWMLTDLSGMVR